MGLGLGGGGEEIGVCNTFCTSAALSRSIQPERLEQA